MLFRSSNRVFVSSVSFWEFAIKYNLNRLELPNIDIHKIPVMCKAIGFEFFDLSPVDALESFRLSRKDGHRDPFDRMLIHLAIKHSYTLVTCDPKARLYGVDGLEYFW